MRPNVTPQVLAWEPLAASRFPELYEGEHVQEPQPPPYLLARLTILKPISKNYGFYMFFMFLIRKLRFLVFFTVFSPIVKKPVFFPPKNTAPWSNFQVVLHGDGTLNEPLRLAPYEGAFFLAGLWRVAPRRRGSMMAGWDDFSMWCCWKLTHIRLRVKRLAGDLQTTKLYEHVWTMLK